MHTIKLISDKYKGAFYVRGYETIDLFLSAYPFEIWIPVFGEYVHLYTDEVQISMR